MRNLLVTTCLGAAAVFAGGAASANDELIKMSQNPKEWVMPAGNFANTRYSKLKQITAENVGKLQVAWTFSTGVLRGHEGGPLVIGDVMYVHAPFPNTVFALDLNNDGKILWKYEPKQDPNVIPVMCCDTVNRGLSPMLTARSSCIRPTPRSSRSTPRPARSSGGEERRSGQGRDRHIGTARRQGQGPHRHLGRRVRRAVPVTAYNIKDGKQVWRGYSMGPDERSR